MTRAGCSSAGRAGRRVIGRLLVQILALGWAELHVEVSLGKMLISLILYLVLFTLLLALVGKTSNHIQYCTLYCSSYCLLEGDVCFLSSLIIQQQGPSL